MDPKRNPFAPGAGHPPPELAGRSSLLERADITLARLKGNKPTKGLLLVGLRGGVGKTVVLNHIQNTADADSFQTMMLECVDEKRLEAMILPPLRSLLFSLDRMEGLSEKVKTGLRVLKGFMSRVKLKYGDIEMTLDVPAEEGTADSGDLEADLPELMLAVGQQLRGKRRSS